MKLKFEMFFNDPHPSQLGFAPQTPRCDTFPLPMLRMKEEGSRCVLMVAPRNAGLEAFGELVKKRWEPRPREE